MHNYDTLKASCKSYMEAVRQITAVCSRVEISSSGYTNRLGEDFRGMDCTANAKKLATGCRTAKHESLFDFSRPQHVGPGWHIWTGSFFKVELEYGAPYQIHSHDFGKACAANHLLRVYYGGRSWGLKDWAKKAGEIEEYAAKCSVVAGDMIRKALGEANKEVARWVAAMEKPSVDLAGLTT